MALKWPLVVLLPLVLALILFSLSNRHPESRVRVTLSRRNIPLIMCRALTEHRVLALDLGSMQSLSLYEDVLKTLGLNEPHTSRAVGFQDGQVLDIEKYRLEGDVMIGTVPYASDLVGMVTDRSAALGIINGKYRRDRDGNIGVQLAHDHRLLLLFNRHEMIIDPTKDTLRQCGFSAEKIVEASLFPNRWIVFQLQLDSSPLVVLLDTGCSRSLLDSKVFKSDGLLENRDIAVNGVSFGSLEWMNHEFPDFLDGINGILGMDFLLKHPVYINYKAGLIYFKKPQVLCEG